MPQEYVILVDEQDKELGMMEKMQAHLEGKLHRALSIFVFNSKKQLLLQKRANNKYHSAGLWTNTCCSHPRKNEAVETAANRRLQEEMGMSCELQYQFNFIYKAQLENNLTEHELDYVYTGFSDVTPITNTGEVSAYRYASIEEIENDLKLNPQNYTAWFALIFKRVKNTIK
jgi:isopentenyl-diphosphate delta-isomerase